MKKVIMCLSLFLCVVLCNTYTNSIAVENTKQANTLVDSTLNEQNIYLALLLNNIKYPEVVLSQIMIETGYLNSRLCKINNNLLGMMVPSKRETTAINQRGFAKYLNWFDCILDYKLYQDYIFSRNNIQTKKQYIAFLHRNYAKSPSYKKRLTELSKDYEGKNSYNFTFNYEKNIQ
jgi:uncharacterized FlgJ-related protein